MSEQASVSCRETARVNVGRMFACMESSSCPAQHPSDWQRIAPARAWPSAPAVGRIPCGSPVAAGASTVVDASPAR
ncbi:hypothetical protein M431DRAFT_234368 [Trichoderma harzianum CBS 226.95]|uniref:Uncharacterized protein n=1 Tax=Trichoderma harzianum CBS 226.95 TaxID=983964 RepID=A0A2T4A1Z6_TRIHA|nr:hypothetical protein M431DRAFT_234368 [Trichoderma harzianum CBS 226.95]PTB51097.1 hypothetical protein M431DRAFT_234368 [Trichoderma harzianum CBS 226.95]